MTEDLNLTQVLKGCPKGTKLYSTIYGEVEFIRIDNKSIDYPIDFNTFDGYTISLTSDGRCNKSYDGECTLFPSKDQRDWSKWHRPFIDGDIIFTYIRGVIDNKWLSIFRRTIDNRCETYVDMNISDHDFYINEDENKYFCNLFDIKYQRLATDIEKQKLFEAIRKHGYKWNAETETLEKITDVKESRFHPKTLKPFDKVLVKQHERMPWCADFYSYYDEDDGFVACTGEVHYDYCIPYNEETKHLTGTVDDAPEFYRYWED